MNETQKKCENVKTKKKKSIINESFFAFTF